MRAYHRSTHNLSYAWRSTMGVGTLVPCMKLIALRGDTFDIDIDAKVLTHPTVGPLFGSYKLQIDIFSCPIRLYQAMLHNNALNVGLDMSKVKLPKIEADIKPEIDSPTVGNEWSQINPSSLLSYLGQKGWSGKIGGKVKKNGLPLLMYGDIFKNYYANKQETDFYAIMGNKAPTTIDENSITYQTDETGTWVISGTLQIQGVTPNITIVFTNHKWSEEDLKAVGVNITREGQLTTFDFDNVQKRAIYGLLQDVYSGSNVFLKNYKLEEFDNMREYILSKGIEEVVINQSTTESQYYSALLGRIDQSKTAKLQTTQPNSGLLLKTHQSDIFNNWVNTEWIDGENGINKITAVDTSAGSFELDALNLAQKVYNMLNRIATSGGTYQDWLDVVYTDGKDWHTETPMYEGGYSSEIQFDEVVSNSATAEQPLGTLAGRGISVGKKGGKLHIKIDEHSVLMGIVSITPHVDYSQGNDWDIELNTMNDFRKPALDGIGFQDLTLNKIAWWKEDTEAIGKQPAWLDYMTNFNKTFGNFAANSSEAFMCLNRIYEPENGNYNTGAINSTTYINPADYTYIFAEQSLESQDFWVQIGFGIKARRVGGAKQIPNL